MAEDSGLTLILIFVAGTLAMLTLALGLFFFFVTYQKRIIAKQLELNQIKSEQQEELLRNTIYAQENERKRFAEDLHDEIGAMLSAVKLNLARMEKRAEEPEVRNLTANARRNVEEVILHIRRITRALLPPSLERFGLGIAISELINWIEKTETSRIVFHEGGNIRRFDIRMEMTVFRIVQELLNNALKYSTAPRIDIRLKYTAANLFALVADNGVGFSVDAARGKGLGLQNLEGRARVMNARIKIKSRPGHGSSAIIALKITENG
jgi:signal transduction histidine kinase